MNFLHPVDGPLRPISYVSMCTPHLGSRRVGGSVPRSLFKVAILRTLCRVSALRVNGS